MSTLDVFDIFSRDYAREKFESMSLRDWLLAARDDKMLYATPAERMIAAIGEPELMDTAQDARLGRMFFNRTIKVYRAFDGFFGMEDTIERIVGYFKHAAQGLEEKRQILYLLGPVGGGKSSLAERLKDLMEVHPIYVLKAGDAISPVFESPLGLFRSNELANLLAERYGIERHRVGGIMSPWAVKRLDEFGGDISKFEVAKVYPSKLRQYAIAKTEPGDENNQDISALTGKVDIRKLEHFGQNDPDAYAFSGGLCRSNQGLLEFVEMFKAPIKVLHPLLTATQEGNYIGTETLGPIPYNGVILAHSNEAEWTVFKGNRNNEAFLDRISVVTVPYCLRVTEETQIYKKLLAASNLINTPTAPETLEMLAKFCVATRLKEHENSNIISKMRVYDGEKLKDTDPKAKTLQEYKDMAGVDEGMTGISTRFAYKTLSETFNYDVTEVGADLGDIIVEGLRQGLVCETCRNSRHAFVDAGHVFIFLQRLGLGIGVLELFAVIDAHLRDDVGVLMLLEPRGDAELRQHLERLRCGRRVDEIGSGQQLLVNLRLFRHAQAVRHGHDADAVEECLVVAVALEHRPLRLVRVREDDAIIRNRTERFGADIVAFLRRGQQRMQNLDRRLEHLDEFEKTLIRPAEASREGIGVGIILAEMLELPDVDLAGQRRDILIVLVPRLGLGDGVLPQFRGIDFGHFELRNVAAEFVQPLHGPRTHDAAD